MGVWAQNGTQKKAAATPAIACPAARDVEPAHLWGLWRVSFETLPGATLLFEKHPEFAGSVSGAINRAGVQSLVAGDADDGVFTLEESLDGSNITATWNGTIVDNSCAKEIRGIWKNVANGQEQAFVLHKLQP